MQLLKIHLVDKVFYKQTVHGNHFVTAEMQNNNFYCRISRDRWDMVQHSMALSIRLNGVGLLPYLKQSIHSN